MDHTDIGTAVASTYETDFYAWTQRQAALLRSGQVALADLENIAEEIESMGRSEKRELVNRMKVLLLHLMKWRYQPGYRSNSWRLTIKEQRLQVEDHLHDNPSLKAHLPEVIVNAYRLARVRAQRETGFGEDTFPDQCPFNFQQMMDADFLPD